MWLGRARLTGKIVVHHLHASIYHSPPASAPRSCCTSVEFGSHQLPPGRSYANRLRHSGAISLRNPVYLQIPYLERYLVWTRVRHDAHLEVYFVPSATSTRALAISWLDASGRSGMDCWVCIQKRHTAGSSEVAGTELGLRWGRAKGSIRSSQAEDGG